MKNIGLALITLAFIGGAYISVIDATEVMWNYFFVAFVTGAAGVAMARIATKKAATTEEALTTNMGAVRTNLSKIVEIVKGLDDEKNTIATYDMRTEIDLRGMDAINAFVESREAISHVYGLQAYADVMSHYAGGERFLNRVWSASADGYVDEVNMYLGRALEQFEIARDKLAAVEAESSTW